MLVSYTIMPLTAFVQGIAWLLVFVTPVFGQTGFVSDHGLPDPKAPGSTPIVFAPGIVSTDLAERDLSISPSGDWLAFTVMAGRSGTIVLMHNTDKGWGQPQVAPFSGHYSDLEPFFFGKDRLYFASNRPTEKGGPKDDYDIWYVEYSSGVWKSPLNLGELINSAGNEYYPSVSANRDLYFTAEREHGIGGEDIWVARFNGKTYQKPVPVPGSVNTKGLEFNATVSLDAKVLLFSSFGRADGFGGGDLYLSRRMETGEWGPARHLPKPINSVALDYCPSISPDGKYLFFSSKRSTISDQRSNPLSYMELSNKLRSPMNGLGDIFWVVNDVIFEH